MPNVGIISAGRSSNIKTGDVPTIAIGRTREESIATCRTVKCPLLHHNQGGLGGTIDPETDAPRPICYSQHGSPSFGHHSQVRKHKRGGDTSLSTALRTRSPLARMARIASIGDPAGLPAMLAVSIVSRIRKAGLAAVGYTHGWEAAPWLKGRLMASCDTPEQVDKAIAKGWRAVVVLPWDYKGRSFKTPGGIVGPVCPAQLRDNVTCNGCGGSKGPLCDAARKGPPVGFIDHGPNSKGRQATKLGNALVV